MICPVVLSNHSRVEILVILKLGSNYNFSKFPTLNIFKIQGSIVHNHVKLKPEGSAPYVIANLARNSLIRHTLESTRNSYETARDSTMVGSRGICLISIFFKKKILFFLFLV